MDKEDQLEVSAAAFTELEAMHVKFMASVGSLKTPKVNGAEFGVADSELHCTCLGVSLKAPHRLIARDGSFVGIEYTFHADCGGALLPIWSMYLMPNERLYEDSGRVNVICDAANRYLPTRIAPLLASALMASPVFAARA